MNLCVDIGNTTVKAAVYSGQDIAGRYRWIGSGKKELAIVRKNWPGIDKVIICSVREENDKVLSLLRETYPSVLVLNHNTPVPVKNLYRTKETLGNDRLAAVTGACNNFPGKPVLVIDAGTAITYDLADSRARYLGGNISPGLNLRYRALHEFTGKLPLVKEREEVPLIGDNTNDAIAAGVVNGIVYEIDGFIDKIKAGYNELVTILTGGDAEYFDKKLKSTIFVDPDLVFTGLNRILTYNVKQF